MERVILTKDGRLLERRWKYDHEKEEGRYVERDVSDVWPQRLFERCALSREATLDSVFRLLERRPHAVETVFGRRGVELLSDARSPLAADHVPDDKPLDYLELYWIFEEDDDERTFGGFSFPNLHGVRRGEDVQYGVEFVPANQMLGLRLRLRSFAKVCPGHKAIMAAYRAKKRDGTPVTPPRERRVESTLGHVLHGILWELVPVIAAEAFWAEHGPKDFEPEPDEEAVKASLVG